MAAELRIAPVESMHPVTLYRMLQLRTNVFVVEQQCPYPELDGRDIEPGSHMVWAEDGDRVLATLRILRDDVSERGDAVLRIGRVTAHSDARGSGLAQAMFAFALEQCAHLGPGLAQVLDAQAPLEGWYGKYGFVRTGETFLEDDIPHVPMRREAA